MQRRKMSMLRHQTYGSFDLGIRVPSSFIRSLMLNLRLLSTVHGHERQKKTTTHTQRLNAVVLNLHCMPLVLIIKLDSLRLWLSFFCLSFISALASESVRQIHAFHKHNWTFKPKHYKKWGQMFKTATVPVISLLIFGRSAGQELLTVRVGAAIPGLWYTSNKFPGSYRNKTSFMY